MIIGFKKPTFILNNARLSSHLVRKHGVGQEQFALFRHYANARLFKEQMDDVHLGEAMAWLCRAQDVCGGKGVSCVYDFKNGWGVAYPETSGYIMATLLAYADLTGAEEYVDRAVRIGDWEVDIQTTGGGVLSNPLHTHTRVFNTGQVILGWCALYERTHVGKYLEAARRAGDYLVRLQETDGSWIKDTYCGARTYHSRVDWSLLRLANLTGEKCFAEAARANLRWVLAQQKENGWFANCGFNNDRPIMHVIVYTLRGLLESHLTGIGEIQDLNILPKVVKAADALCSAAQRFPIRGVAGMVPTSFDENWQSDDRHSCLTGDSQLACFLFRLAVTTSNDKYRHVADAALGAVKRTQIIETRFNEVKGAIAGSYPFSIGYHPSSYPNWATKFFADALMMKMHFAQKRTVPA